MILSLISLAWAAEANLQILSEKTFVSQVQNHPPNEVWLVMFVAGESDQAAFEAFRNASEISSGMVKFAMLDVRRAPSIPARYELRTFPSWRVFHGQSVSEVKASPTVNNFLKICLRLVEDFSQNVTAEWKNEFTGKPAAILFTNQEKTAFWSGISSYFAKKDVRIGTCRDPALAAEFGVTTLPKLVFFNGSARHEYTGDLKFRAIKAAIEEWFKNRLEREEPEETDEMMMPDQFVPQCVGGKHLCVLAATKTPPEGMNVLVKSGHGRRHIKCFAGAVNLPYKFMEAGGVWIYNPRRDAFIHVTDTSTLMQTMDRVIDGSAKWTRRAEYEHANGEL